MECPSCDQENREGTTSCDSCGAKLSDTEAEAAPLPLGISLSSGFVGRQREITELNTDLDDVLLGQGRLTMLAGEPGIGKTRIAQELATHAGGKGCSQE